MCTLILSTPNSFTVSLESDLPGYEIDWSYYQEDATWKLEATTVSWAREGNIFGITTQKSLYNYHFLLSRRPTWYIINIILPIIFLSTTTPVVFLLPVDAGEKMGTSITVLLSFAVYLTIIADYLPETSVTTSGLAVYLTVMLAVCAQAFLFSAFIISLYWRGPEEKVPEDSYWVKLTRFIQLITLRGKAVKGRSQVKPEEESRPSHNGSQTPISILVSPANAVVGEVYQTKEKAQEPLTWKEVAATFDWFLFLVFTLGIILITFIVMVYLIGEGEGKRQQLIDSMESGQQN